MSTAYKNWIIPSTQSDMTFSREYLGSWSSAPYRRITGGLERAVNPIDYQKLDPCVRDLVKVIRTKLNIETTSSGDGSRVEDGSLEERHVFMVCSPTYMLEKTLTLQQLYPTAHVECSYVPGEDAVIVIFPDGRPVWDQK